LHSLVGIISNCRPVPTEGSHWNRMFGQGPKDRCVINEAKWERYLQLV